MSVSDVLEEITELRELLFAISVEFPQIERKYRPIAEEIGEFLKTPSSKRLQHMIESFYTIHALTEVLIKNHPQTHKLTKPAFLLLSNLLGPDK